MFYGIKYLIVTLVFSHLGFWSGNLFLIASFPDLCLLVPFHLSIPNVDFIAILIKLATCRVPNAFKMPLPPNAPTVRVLTSVILKGIGWAFKKLYPTKIPGMVHQGLLAPQRL